MTSATRQQESGPSRVEVWKMFDRIAPSYDALNRILSLRRDVAWRRRMAHFLPREGPLDLLDLATGTGDQIIELKKSGVPIGKATGMDLSEGMLDLGREKLRDLGWEEIEMLVGDVMDIPAADDAFDAVTISFGIRNVLDVPKGLQEIQRVLKPGGTLLILECSMPQNAVLRKFYSFYFRHILPFIGGLVSGDSSAYRYLNETVESFPCGESFCDLLRSEGYQEVAFEPQTLGVATIYQGFAPQRVDRSMEQSFEKSSQALAAASRLEALHGTVLDMVDQLENQIRSDPDRLHLARRTLEAADPLLWLSTQSLPHKIYWKSRNGDVEAAACGVCRSVERNPEEDSLLFIQRVREELAAIPGGSPRAYGGIAFDSTRSPGESWTAFGNGCFTLPLLELRGSGEGWTLTLQGDGQVLEDLRALRTRAEGLEELDAGIPPPVSRHDFPHQEAWIQRVEKALTAFDQGELSKIVLARKAVYRFDDELNVFALLKRLQDQTPNCFHFLFQVTEKDSFIGASPERLYRRCGMDGQSEAVAGTRPRGASEKIDRREGEKLIESEKDQREHEFVRESILRTLEPLSDSVRLDTRARLLKLSRGQHLYSGFEMQLRPGISDAELVTRLHPTPAVGGEPREAALQALRDWEEFNRGWYAAPVGWIEENGAEFAVAIRSGLVQGNCLSLFSGAGIVKGSDPDAEWSEVENKISDFIHILTQR